MRNAWMQLARISLMVFAVFAVLGLVPYLNHAIGAGWPGGFLPYLWATVAGWVGSLDWYLPVAALAGGVAFASAMRERGRHPYLHVLLGCAAFAALSFALRGYIGPYLEHNARLGLLDMANPRQAELAGSLQPNDWSFLRALAAREGTPGLVATVHATVAFALLSAVMLPLGLAIGNGSRRFRGAARRRAGWIMAAGTTAVVYGAQIGAWRLAMAAAIWPAALVYFGFLTVPFVILLTLVWAGAARPQGPGARSASSYEDVA